MTALIVTNCYKLFYKPLFTRRRVVNKYATFTIKELFLFLIGGFLYYSIEILWRGFSHWSMFILGGLCFIYAGLQNEYETWDYPFYKQLGKVESFVLCAEFFTGCVVNILLKWDIWDYSSLPLNVLGQVCIPYAILWIPLCSIAIILDDYIRWIFFHEEQPRYKFF